MYSKSRYSTCIPEELGGSGNPSPHTAKGVVCAMEGALDYLKMGDIQGKTIAMMVSFFCFLSWFGLLVTSVSPFWLTCGPSGSSGSHSHEYRRRRFMFAFLLVVRTYGNIARFSAL